MKKRTMLWCMVGAGATAGLMFVATGVASRSGADAFFSGGPVGNAWNCTNCHALNQGNGGVQVSGFPSRYRSNTTYDLTVRVFDVEQVGAGFEVSAENDAGHVGSFMLSDAIHTKFAGFGSDHDYVTHTSAGVDASLATWDANGGAYTYQLQWRSPRVNAGDVTVFAAGNAINNASAFFGDRYYAGHATAQYAMPGDVDGDTDADLRDFAALVDCFDGICPDADLDGDGVVALEDVSTLVVDLTGPTVLAPPAYVLADGVRGGVLYDTWWNVNGAPVPTGDHPLYPEVGVRTGNTTFRCKECHGWDYKGSDGVYGTGSHFTGIRGILDTALSPQAIFDLLKADPGVVPHGHNMSAYGMTDADLWDVVKMTLEGTTDTDDYIDATSLFMGDAFAGMVGYLDTCQSCHGNEGRDLNFGTDLNPEYVGTIANANPWEFLHKVRFGHPGAPMPSFELLRWSTQAAADIGLHATTLPVD